MKISIHGIPFQNDQFRFTWIGHASEAEMSSEAIQNHCRKIRSIINDNGIDAVVEYGTFERNNVILIKASSEDDRNMMFVHFG